MTRAQMYEELTNDGAKLHALGSMKYDELAKLYKERFGVDPGADKSTPGTTGSEEDKSGSTDKGASEGEGEGAVEGEDKGGADSGADAGAGEGEGEQNKPKAETAAEPPARIPTLVFSESGWCEALKRSYFRGNYRPKSRDEYLALKGFASKEI